LDLLVLFVCTDRERVRFAESAGDLVNRMEMKVGEKRYLKVVVVD